MEKSIADLYKKLTGLAQKHSGLVEELELKSKAVDSDISSLGDAVQGMSNVLSQGCETTEALQGLVVAVGTTQLLVLAALGPKGGPWLEPFKEEIRQSIQEEQEGQGAESLFVRHMQNVLRAIENPDEKPKRSHLRLVKTDKKEDPA